MRLIKKFYPLILFIGIIFIGVIRMMEIHSYEYSIGRSTMSGSFTFGAYSIIAIIVTAVSLIIMRINSVKESVLNRTVKLIFIITIISIFIPIISIILFFFH